MSAADCRELWERIETVPQLRVESVIVSSVSLRWAVIVGVPWSRYGVEVATREDLAKLLADLAKHETNTAAAETVPAECETNTAAAETVPAEHETPAAEYAARKPAAVCGQMELFAD